jgi:hypothetical protein
MAKITKRLVGPEQLGSSTATLYTVPDGTRTKVRQIQISNPTGGSQRTYTLSIGADPASTRFRDGEVIAAGDTHVIHGPFTIEAGTILAGHASAASALVILIDGIEYILSDAEGPTPGENLPARHTQNVTRQYYVDAALGNDATTEANARDNPSNPWLTIQHAVDALSWPGAGDIAINVRNGTYQAADNSADTVHVALGAGGPNSGRRLVFRPDGSATPLVRLPGGATGTQRTGFKLTDGYCTVEGFEIDSTGTPGATNCGGNAFWLPGTSAHSEIYRCHCHDLHVAAGATSRIQGIQTENSTGFQIWYTKFHEVGSTSDQANQEHGVYMQGEGWVIGCLIYNIRNGYGLQIFDSTWGDIRLISNTIAVGPASATRESMVYDDRNAGGSGVLTMRNNILFGAVSGRNVLHGAGTAASAGQHTLANNIVRRNGGVGSGDVEFIADFVSTNLDTTHDPGFVNFASEDFHLDVAAAARGAADPTWSPPSDLDGVDRDYDSCDLGAYQYTP